MNQSDQINELATALCKFQGTVGPIYKNKTAKITTKTGVTYTYNYSDLPGVLDVIKTTLMETGLSVCQMFVGSEIVTSLMHSSGQWMNSRLPLNFDGLKPQELGSLITYMRRYALTAILGICADEDDDGNAATQDIKPLTKESLKKENGKYISAEQVRILENLLSQCAPHVRENMLNYYEISSFEKIPEVNFESLRLLIINRIPKKEAAHV